MTQKITYDKDYKIIPAFVTRTNNVNIYVGNQLVSFTKILSENPQKCNFQKKIKFYVAL